ncbi:MULTISPECIES: hypothetical protein [unclassified Clostridium]|uniref:hypothetical protein n=1 Tax=unclassified Clostridium TaxID=2614128 RepID=UPI0005FB51BF|nr:MULTISPECIES: hypothetical protein [unclassified Clostridium]
MEGYVAKIKVKPVDEMYYDDVIKKYGIGEYEPQDLTIGISGMILTIYKKPNEINEVNKYI